MKILFIVPYPLKQSPSQRFRFEQYFTKLEEHGYQMEIQSFLDSQNWQIFFKSGNTAGKARALVKGFLKRLFILIRLRSFDFVFIHREATPVGPPFFEWVTMLLGKKMIYDFDDAIWLTDRPQESWFLKTLKWRSKVRTICAWSWRVSAGNRYLCDFALQVNPNVYFNPTTVDTVHAHNPELFEIRKTAQSLTLGWTGSHSTLKYLKTIELVLQQIEQKYPFIKILVIADHKPDLDLKTLEFIKWNAESEVEDLLRLDIGLMPLPDDEWANGKCGFKIIQYLSLNIPAIASPVGVNPNILQHGVTGFLCSTAEQWHGAIQSLIEDEKLRRSFGRQGRYFIEQNYSTGSNTFNFLSLFEAS